MYFYPRSPCGERHFSGSAWVQEFPISIHALLAESDVSITIITICIVSFLSTLSLRRATSIQLSTQTPLSDFYPRSPCGERPPGAKSSTPDKYYFYPRSPCGERPLAKVRHCEGYIFLSTLSLRRATGGHQKQYGVFGISIHALLAESDLKKSRKFWALHPVFLSTLSLRRATQ